MDVKTTFLHDELRQDIIRNLSMDSSNHLDSYIRFAQFMAKHNFNRSLYNNCVYHKSIRECVMIYLLLYVNDILIACQSKSQIEILKLQLSKDISSDLPIRHNS